MLRSLICGLGHGKTVSIVIVFGKDMKRPWQTTMKYELRKWYCTIVCLNHPQSTPRNILLGQLPMFASCFSKMCRPCALHPRQSLIALNVCRAWRLWWRDIPWRLLRWMLLKHTNGAILQLCFVFFWKKFTSVLSLFNDRCICLSLWQVHASISRITATRSEMPKGRDSTWTWMYNDVHGYGRIQQLFRY